MPSDESETIRVWWHGDDGPLYSAEVEKEGFERLMDKVQERMKYGQGIRLDDESALWAQVGGALAYWHTIEHLAAEGNLRELWGKGDDG